MKPSSKKKLMTLLVLLRLLLMLKKRNSRFRSVGVRSLFKRRRELGDGHHLINELQFESAMFFNYTRLNYERFDFLLRLVTPLLKKRNMSTSICPQQRLAMTLRHLAIGDSRVSLSYAYRCGRTTVSVILRETLGAIINVLHNLVLAAPSSKEQWKTISAGFFRRWNLPHCVGAIDGRHMQIQCPQASGSTYFNYKKTFSISLMAVADSDYSFLMVDVGAEGSLSDSAVFKDSEIGKRLERKKLKLPDADALPNSQQCFGYYFVGDSAFQLREDLMKPYAARKLSMAEAVYNYRISRARRVVENAFGILVSRWRIFRQPLLCSLKSADLIVLGAVCLHNFIIRSCEHGSSEEYAPNSMVDIEESDGLITNGSWRALESESTGALQHIPGTRSRNNSKCATHLRQVLTEYLNKEGAVEWQEERVRNGFWGAFVSGEEDLEDDLDNM